jgi:hypothetical protein
VDGTTGQCRLRPGPNVIGGHRGHQKLRTFPGENALCTRSENDNRASRAEMSRGNRNIPHGHPKKPSAAKPCAVATPAAIPLVSSPSRTGTISLSSKSSCCAPTKSTPFVEILQSAERPSADKRRRSAINPFGGTT